jgi:hypothetical protein
VCARGSLVCVRAVCLLTASLACRRCPAPAGRRRHACMHRRSSTRDSRPNLRHLYQGLHHHGILMAAARLWLRVCAVDWVVLRRTAPIFCPAHTNHGAAFSPCATHAAHAGLAQLRATFGAAACCCAGCSTASQRPQADLAGVCACRVCVVVVMGGIAFLSGWEDDPWLAGRRGFISHRPRGSVACLCALKTHTTCACWLAARFSSAAAPSFCSRRLQQVQELACMSL